MIKIDTIPIAKIKDDPSLYPENFEKEKWKDLARSISQISVLELVIVQELKKGYLRLSGKRRLKATLKAEKEETTAIIVQDNKLSEEKIQMIKNLQPEEMDPLERAILIQNYIDEERITKVEASKRLNIPRTTIDHWLIILDFEEPYQDAVVNNFHDKGSTLTLSHLAMAKRMENRTCNPQRSRKLLNSMMKYKLTRKQSKKVRDLIRKHPHLNIEEAAEIISNQSQLEEDLVKNDNISKEAKEIVSTFKGVNEKLEEMVDVTTEMDEKTEKNLLKEFLLMEQTLQEIVMESFGVSLEEARKELLQINNLKR